MNKEQPTQTKRGRKGFQRTSGLIQSPIRKASEGRGFANSRLLTHWEEVVGADIAKIAHPVKVSYSKGAFGATLVVLTTGAYAPIVQARLPEIMDRVNSVYGYNAISRIHVTQTAAVGFAEGRATFQHKEEQEDIPSEETLQQARAMSDGAEDETLKDALETLATNFLRRQQTKEKEKK